MTVVEASLRANLHRQTTRFRQKDIRKERYDATSTFKGTSNSINRDSHSDAEIAEILRSRNVAVVGISRDKTKPSYYVSKYLMEHGYNVVPVNLYTNQILGRKCFASLLQVQETVDIVEVFRPSADVQAAISKKPKAIRLQEEIHNADAEEYALKPGIEVVWNRCMMKDHARPFGRNSRVSLSQA